jgi:hypothetical protein
MFIILFVLFIGIPLLKEEMENQSYRNECRRRGYVVLCQDLVQNKMRGSAS